VSCYHPLQAYRTPHGVVFQQLKRYDIIGDIKIPCGQCIGCRMKRASDWELRIMHEAQLYKHNCFITLTYGRNQMPANGSLDHRDCQLFYKRLRKHLGTEIRYYHAGEYGGLNGRPHYHACLFGHDFYDRKDAGNSKSGMPIYNSDVLTQIWGLGKTSVQDLTNETASYCARYIMTKQLGPNTDYGNRKPEYATMSKGIGKRWLQIYHEDVYRHDHVISRGVKRRPPKYYDSEQKRRQPDRMEEIKYQRELNAQTTAHDATPERLAVRETVHLAKLRNLKRDLDHDAS